MLIEKRLNDILKLVNERKSVSVLELTDKFHASESTIRRDLTVLHQRGLLNKVHGGATSLEMGYAAMDDEVAIRENLNREEKEEIARYAAALIQDNDFVYLDAGTTTEQMIDFIEARHSVFVTNAVSHAKKLAKRGFRVYMLGGEFKPATEAVVGSETIASLNKYHFTKCFVGTNGVSVTTGFSTPDLNEALVKEKALEQSKDRYILCDSSKFNKISPVMFGEFSRATVITSRLQDDTYRQYSNIKEVKKV